MAIKINKIIIEGLRGVKERLELSVAEKSVLIYGDNGTGKSSISDSLEWFFNDDVRHLAGSEIDLKEALRNSTLSNTEKSSLQIEFSRAKINSNRILSFSKDKFVAEYSNKSSEFESYINQSLNENLILRYQFLSDFVDKTKGEKLKSLSDVIGFAEINKVKEVLKKGYNSIKNEIKTQNYEGQINTQKRTQIEKLGAAIGVESDLFKKIREVIAPLKLKIAIKSFKDIDKLLDSLKVNSNSKALHELKYLETCQTVLNSIKSEAGLLDAEYSKYYSEFKKVSADVESIMQVFFDDLLRAGKTLIEKKYHKQDSCPLCLQPKNKDELLFDIIRRLKEIEESTRKKASFESAKQLITKIASERLKRLERLTGDDLYDQKPFKSIKTSVDRLISRINLYLENGSIKVTSGKKIIPASTLKLKDSFFTILAGINSKIIGIKKSLDKDDRTVIYSNISSAKEAFLRIKRFEKERKKLEDQRQSMSIIYNEFVKKQKEALETFINTFSTSINEYYQFMNPGEQFQEIRIVTIGDDDELNGITIEYKYNSSWVSPPQKYFSESHLNCFGLSFFLASVKAFNKENRFLLLDDVISSFDTTHRKKFADLLLEKFSDYQIILLTHENHWFQYVSQLAKKKGWLIKEIKWDDSIGTYLDDQPTDLRETIDFNLKKGNIALLGNPIRKYLEHTLKDICANLEVKVNFRFNELNEKRMPDELLNELKSKIGKSSTELKAQLVIIDRITNSNILGNLLSHDNPFTPNLGDLKSFWDDFIQMEKLFYCSDSACRKPGISVKNYDTVAKKIRCSCDKLKYDWKI